KKEKKKKKNFLVFEKNLRDRKKEINDVKYNAWTQKHVRINPSRIFYDCCVEAKQGGKSGDKSLIKGRREGDLNPR
ncbi:hypothetical protein, partial [Escherichia coli]|uniref:hypothetical protein n=1 Tax=Escherichia coli TaxID=562 RepID=UPI001BAF1BAC